MVMLQICVVVYKVSLLTVNSADDYNKSDERLSIGSINFTSMSKLSIILFKK
jgi:hypothetical protein